MRTILFLFFSCIIVSCRDKCNCFDFNRDRPLSVKAMEWVEVLDSTPDFKVTYFGPLGEVTQIDTIEGYYEKDSIEEHSELYGDDGCCIDRYHETGSRIIIPNGKGGSLGGGIFVNNKSTDGYNISLFNRVNFQFNDKTVPDTAFVNGKVYHDVLKMVIPATSSYEIYYSKGIGVVYTTFDKSKYQVERIP